MKCKGWIDIDIDGLEAASVMLSCNRVATSDQAGAALDLNLAKVEAFRRTNKEVK
jgi:hypothetical protein